MGERVFISYTKGDREFARLLDASLRIADVETIRDERHMVVGDSIPNWVFTSIARATAAIFVISPRALDSSWLEEEISAAKTRQIESRDFKILPLILEGVEPPAALRHARGIRFSNWRDADDFRLGVASLLHGLGIEPVLISGDEVEWWLAEQPAIGPARDALAVAYGYFDAAVGYTQWFPAFSPLRWVEKEMVEGEFREALAVLSSRIPERAEDPRFATLRKGLADIEKWRHISRPDRLDEAHHWARKAWIPLGRILGVLSEMEAATTMAVRAGSNVPKGAAPAPVEPIDLEGPFRVAADAADVLQEDEPGAIDLLWSAYKVDGDDDALGALLDAMDPVRNEAVDYYRRELSTWAGTQLGAAEEGDLRGLIDGALRAAINRHRPDLGLSIQWTARRHVRDAIHDKLADRRERELFGDRASEARAHPTRSAIDAKAEEDSQSADSLLPPVVSVVALAAVAYVFVAAWRAGGRRRTIGSGWR